MPDVQSPKSNVSCLLEVRNISVYYGSVKALENVSLEVNEGEIVAMIGPNGAGKSTALKTVSGLLNVSGGEIKSGEVLFQGENIKGLRTDELVKKGLSLVPEGRHVFPTMTVLENLEMGGYTIVNELVRLGVKSSLVEERIRKVFELFTVLKDKRKQKAGTLSSGEQQMLAIGRALMLNPKLLLLDEPSLGLSPNYIITIFKKLIELKEKGINILLVEQNTQMALKICNRAYVYGIGHISMKGTGKELLNDENIKKAFLGG